VARDVSRRRIRGLHLNSALARRGAAPERRFKENDSRPRAPGRPSSSDSDEEDDEEFSSSDSDEEDSDAEDSDDANDHADADESGVNIHALAAL